MLRLNRRLIRCLALFCGLSDLPRYLAMILSSRRTLVQALIVSALIHFALMMRVVDWVPLQLELTSGATIQAVLMPVGRIEAATPVLAIDSNPGVERLLPAPLPVKAESLPAKAGLVRAPPKPLLPPARAAQPSLLPVDEGVSVNDLAEYRVALAMVAKRYKDYPARARASGWEGVVGIELRGSSWASAPEVIIVQSSGQAALDEHALKLTTKALEVTSLPEGLRGKNFRVLLSVAYSLDEAQ